MSSNKFIKLGITPRHIWQGFKSAKEGNKYYWKIGNYKNTPC